jgi:P27 family predicted phage terminase small subunit
MAVLIPDAPANLGEIGQGLWSTLWELGAGLYMVSDQWVLERLCSLMERRYQLLALVDAEGMMTVGSTGQPVVHPAMKMVDAIEGRLPGLEAVLALTPESRARLGLAAIETQNKLDAFLSREGAAA